MAATTIAERLCQTSGLAARHLLQDEAALVGAQGEVSEDLEAKLANAESVYPLRKEYRPLTTFNVRGTGSEQVEAKPTCAEMADLLSMPKL